MNIREITLNQVLDQREKREKLIQAAKNKYPKNTIISFKLNIPGPIKNSDDYLYVFEEGLKLLSRYEIIHDFRLNPTGPEAILVSFENEECTKQKMIAIEDSFLLGRLFDLDVLGSSREQLNFKARTCLICDDIAHNCSRSRKHGLDEVLNEIERIIEVYKND